MRKIELIVIVGVLVLVGGLLYEAIRGISSWPIFQPPQDLVTLKPQEQERVIVQPNKITTVKRDASGKTVVQEQYVPKQAVVTVRKDGSVTVKNKRFGLTLEPQLGVMYSNGVRAALAAKVVYFDRLGLNLGIGLLFSSPPDPIAFTALSYTPFSNTSVFLGVSHRQALCGGLLVRF